MRPAAAQAAPGDHTYALAMSTAVRGAALGVLAALGLVSACSSGTGPVAPPPAVPSVAEVAQSPDTATSDFSAACETWDPRELEWRSLTNFSTDQDTDDAGIVVTVSRASMPPSSSSRYNTVVEICPGFLWVVTHSGDTAFIALTDYTWAKAPALVPSGSIDDIGARGVESGGPVWGFRGSVSAGEWVYLSDAVVDVEEECVRLDVHRLETSSLLGGSPASEVIYESAPCVEFSSSERATTPIKTHLGGALAYSKVDDELYVSLGDFHLGASQIGQAVNAGLEATERDYALLLDDQSALSSVVAIRGPGNGADSRIFAKGLRNSLGMTVAPDGALLLSDHGPGGGDELNIITEGGDYGWPLTSEGKPYDRSAWPSDPNLLLAPWLDNFQAEVPGTTSPVYTWSPAIAPSSVIHYAPATRAVPEWVDDIIIGSLRGQAIVRLTATAEGSFTESRLAVGERIRSLIATSQGFIVLLTDSSTLLIVEGQ